MRATLTLTRASGARIGAYGHLAIFAWSLAAVMLAPQAWFWAAAVLCLGLHVLLYPSAFKRLLAPRFLLFAFLLALPPVFLVGEPDLPLGPLTLSQEGLVFAGQILLRAVVVLVAIGGLTSSVEISALAGLLERLGFHGLGFSVGVALNLLPALQQSLQNTWRSLWMRGGLRRRGWAGLQLFAITVITNALRWAEEIALAAEARAFSPARSRPLPVKRGRLDWFILGGCALSLLALFLLP